MNLQKSEIIYRVLAVLVLGLVIGPVGISCIIEGYFAGNNPCVLCWGERIAIILVAMTTLFILRYGLTYRYIGIWIFVSAYGLWGGYRHASAHILRDIGQGFGPSIFGIHTYVWIMIIFFSLLVVGALCLVYCGDKYFEKPDSWGRMNKGISMLFLVVLGFNIVQALTQVGPPPYLGQSDPYRMSFNSNHIVWSMDKWPSLNKFSLGDFTKISRPDFAIAGGQATVTGKTLSVEKEINLPAEITGLATGISYNAAKDIFAVVTADNWVYLLDGNLERVLYNIHIDGEFSVELSNFAGIAFDGENSLLAVTDHKSYVRFELDEAATYEQQYWKFITASDGIKEIARGRFGTARSKNNYIGDIAWNTATNEYVAVTLPNSKHKTVVMMNLDGQDRGLNSEAKLRLNDDEQALVGNVTGLVIEQNTAYLLNHAANQIVTMDMSNRSLTEVYSLANVNNPEGLTLQAGKLVVLDAARGQNKVNVYAVK